MKRGCRENCNMKSRIIALASALLSVSCVSGPDIAVLYSGPEGPDAELEGLKTVLQQKADVEFVPVGSFAEEAGKFDMIWYHRLSEDAPTPEEEALAADVDSYLKAGGKLVLSMEAVRLMNAWGFEDEPVQTWTYDCIDSGFGRKLGYHAYRSHPLFEDMNAGAYPWHGKEDNKVRINGFQGQSVPKAEGAKVIATQWEYIFNRPDKKVVWETPVGQGLVLSIGSCLYYGSDNHHKDILEQFTGNCVDYLCSEKEFAAAERYWDYTPAEVVAFHDGHREYCRACASEFSPVHPSMPEHLELPGTSMSLSREATSNYFDVVSPYSMVIASEQGGIDEIWTHPFMSMRDYRVYLNFGGDRKRLPLSSYKPVFTITPAYAVREYDIDGFRLKEVITTDIDTPVTVVHYEWEGEGLLDMYVEHTCNLRYMWPYSETALGSLYYGHSVELNGFLVRDSGKEFVSLVGANVPGTFIEGVPSAELHQVTALVRYNVKNLKSMDVVMAAGSEGQEKVLRNYEKALADVPEIFENATEYYEDYMSDVVEIITPDERFNDALKWAQASSAQFIVETPGMGRSLMAGYSSSRRGWGGGHRVSGRPGYAWYFGRDSEWAGFAFADMGDYGTVRNVLSMLIKYQQTNGKMFHELTSSGFVHYDASDAMPLFVSLMAYYLRTSGDVEYVKENIRAVDLAMSYCRSTDSDGDGLIEIDNVGHGWLEGGDLFGSQTEFYLAGIWKAALEDASYIHKICGSKAASKKYAAEAESVTGALEAFWNEAGYYNYALTKEDTYRDEFLVLTAVPVCFDVVDKGRAETMAAKFATPEMSADWGARTISQESGLGEFGAYGPRNVWPLFTGWKSLAEYKTGMYDQGFASFAGSLMTYRDFSLGHIAEVINGDVYRNNGITQHQCWSETMTIMPLMEGMLGYEPDAVAGRMTLSPKLPSHWNRFEARRIRLGDKSLDCIMDKVETGTEWNLESDSRIHLGFNPVFALGTEILGVSVNGRETEFDTVREPQGVRVIMELDLDGAAEILISHKGGLDLVPIVPTHELMAGNTGYRIVSQKLEEDGSLSAEISSVPNSVRTLRFHAPEGYSSVTGIENIREISAGLYEGEIRFEESDSGYVYRTIIIKT